MLHTIVAPAIDYWKHTIEVKKGAQVERMKRVRILRPYFQPAACLGQQDLRGGMGEGFGRLLVVCNYPFGIACSRFAVNGITLMALPLAVPLA